MKATIAAISLLILCIALLIPGISHPMLTIVGTMEKQAIKNTGVQLLAESMVSGDPQNPNYQKSLKRASSIINNGMRFFGIGDVKGQLVAYQKTRSIIGTIEDLYRANNILVALLVALFSIIIPVVKLLMLLIAVLLHSPGTRKILLTFNNLLSKWSMADVFVVALIVTYLAANATSAKAPTGETLLQFNSQFEVGFYYFCAYCLCSIFTSQLIYHWYKTDNHRAKIPTAV